MKNPEPETRSKIYAFVAAVISIMVVLGIINADDLDAEVVADTIVKLIGIMTVLLARFNIAK